MASAFGQARELVEAIPPGAFFTELVHSGIHHLERIDVIDDRTGKLTISSFEASDQLQKGGPIIAGRSRLQVDEVNHTACARGPLTLDAEVIESDGGARQVGPIQFQNLFALLWPIQPKVPKYPLRAIKAQIFREIEYRSLVMGRIVRCQVQR